MQQGAHCYRKRITWLHHLEGEMKKAVKRQLLFWLAVAVLFIGLIALLNDILLPFIVAIGIAYFLDPLVDRLEKTGMSRTIATIFLVIASGLALTLALVILLPLLANQLKSLVASLPDQIQTARDFINVQGRSLFGDSFSEVQSGLDAAFMELSQSWRSSAGEILVRLLSGGMAVLNVLSLFLITPVVAFYMLADWENMLTRMDSWLPRDHAPTIRKLLSEINDMLAGFIRGQGTVCFLLAIFYALGLSWAGLNNAILIGVIAGFAAFVPFVGAALTFFLAGAVALHQFMPDWIALAKVFGILIAGQALEGTILAPRIVGSHVRLHPVWLIFSLFVFGYLFGFVGLLVAVPLAAAIGVVARYALGEYLESEFYRGQSAGKKSKGDGDAVPVLANAATAGASGVEEKPGSEKAAQKDQQDQKSQ